jgi:ELWxxDGT repeat protein
MVADIRSGGQGSFPFSIEAIGSTLYFSADGGNQLGRELWKSDGTAAGTVFIKDIYTGQIGSSPLGFTNVNGTIFFTADTTVTSGQGNHQTTTYYGRELWKTNGTAAGTVMVKDIRPGFGDSGPTELTNLNGTLLFSAYTGELGWELWRSNGTAAGTVLVEDINPTFRSSDPRGLRLHDGKVLFNAIEQFTSDLWQTDGTAAGTTLAADFAPGFTGFNIPSNFITIDGVSYFFAVGQGLAFELWRTDHTAAGTQFLHQILSPNQLQTNPYVQPTFGRAGDKLFFTAFDEHGIGLELHIVTGPTTTALLRDIFPGNAFQPSPQDFTDVSGTLFFTANDGVHGKELWISNGTTAGTKPVREVGVNNPRPIRHEPVFEPQRSAVEEDEVALIEVVDNGADEVA